MNNRFDTIITGSGPAGLFCAIQASSSGRKVLVLEKNSEAGKKLLLSGSGQCNFTHTGSTAEFLKHYGAAKNFVKSALSAFTNTQLVEFFESHGIAAITREDGKIFPASMKARDILTLLLNLCKKNSVEIKYSSPVESVSHNGSEFAIRAGGVNYISKNFVIATGGSSYPATGSSGDGFRLAKKLGHIVTEITPALTPLYIKDYALADLSGISVKGSRITLLRDGLKKWSGSGDVLFTPKGLSGPGILDMSRHAGNGDQITISITSMTPQESENLFSDTLKAEGKKAVRNILNRFDIPERLGDALLIRAGVDPLKKCAGISKTERNRIFELINSFPFTIKEKGNFRVAMATAGGVSRDEIDRRTMESKIIKGLFFAGEVIDVDGDTGGYNIQWAFSSGKAAGESLL